MSLPACFLPRPAADRREDTLDSFEELYRRAVRPGAGSSIDYALEAPLWQFLCYLCDHKEVLVHGSADPDITEFEPRQSNDVIAFGNRRAVYAASDGIWAMYFAIVDRERYITSLVNGCARVIGRDGPGEPYYHFSVNADALPHYPWRNGTVYILPRDTFEPNPRERLRGLTVQPEQWASLVPVQPLARVAVAPHDFPFLCQIRGHDPAVISERARANPDGFPWADE